MHFFIYLYLAISISVLTLRSLDFVMTDMIFNNVNVKVTAKRNGVRYYPMVYFYNNKRDGKILYEGRQDVASLYGAIDEELKYEMPRLISVQSNDYTQLVFDRNADVVLLFLQQVRKTRVT